MKKVLCSICSIILALCVLFPVSVFAEGYISASPTSLTIEQGSSETFTITAYNAIGDVSIKSNNSDVASVDTGDWGTGMVDEKQTKTAIITVTGNSVGTTTITLTIDAATFDEDDLAGQTETITVNVVAKQTPTPTPEPDPSVAILTNIKITKAPTRTAYTEGEIFDKTGMVVTAEYSDGTSKEITNYTYVPSGALKATDEKVTISYTEGEVTKTVDQDITVISASENNTEDNKEETKDDTVTPEKELPKAGVEKDIILVIGLVSIVTIATYLGYKKYKKYKNI